MAGGHAQLPQAPASLAPGVADIARRAGAIAMGYYRGDYDVGHKADSSPVTVADREAEAAIEAGLAELAPDLPIIGEEAVEAQGAPDTAPSAFWLVDPLDGTKEFIKSRDEFTVNIGLVVDGAPVLGVVLAPALDWLYSGVVGAGATCTAGGAATPLAVRPAPAEGLTVVASRSHSDDAALQDFLGDTPVAARRAIGSSLKICLVAAGEADLYPRLGPTMEWDTAAAHAVLAAAGGRLETLDGTPLGYGKADFRNPHFVARGG